MLSGILGTLSGSERRKRTANGGQYGGDEKVIGDNDMSVAREGGGGLMGGCEGGVWEGMAGRS